MCCCVVLHAHPPRRFSAFVSKGIVDDLTGYYNTQQRKFYSIIRWALRGLGGAAALSTERGAAIGSWVPCKAPGLALGS